jgi:hypothetical protein
LVENQSYLCRTHRNEFGPYLPLVFFRITKKVIEGVVDRSHNGLIGLIKCRPRQQNLPYLITFEAEYDGELPVREERALYGGL